MTTTAWHLKRWGDLLVLILLGIVLCGAVASLMAESARHSWRRTGACEALCGGTPLDTGAVLPLPPAQGVAASTPADWIDPQSLVPDAAGRPDPPLTPEQVNWRLAEQARLGIAAPGRLTCGPGGWCVHSDGRVIEVVDR